MPRIVMNIGDRCKDKITAKIYVTNTEIDNDTHFLEGKNRLDRRLVGKGSLEQSCENLEDVKC